MDAPWRVCRMKNIIKSVKHYQKNCRDAPWRVCQMKYIMKSVIKSIIKIIFQIMMYSIRHTRHGASVQATNSSYDA